MKIKLFFTLLLFSILGMSQGTAYTWNCATATPSSGSNSNIVMGSWIQGNNNGITTMITNVSPSSTYLGATGGENFGSAARIGTLNTSSAGSAYFELTITPNTGYSVVINMLSFGSRSTSTGPQAFAIKSSLDGYSSTFSSGTLQANSLWSLNSPGISPTISSAVGTPITIRIYGFFGTGTPSVNVANWRIDDISIDVSSVLPTTSINIYNSNGSLTQNRFVSLGDYNLNFVKGGRVGVGTSNLFSKFTIDDDTNRQFTNIEPSIRDVNALFEIKSNVRREYSKFNISQFKDFTWMQSSLGNEKPSTLSINPLQGNVGVGVLDATAQLHTINSVRFQDLPFNKRPNAILGTDMDGNVYNYDPNEFGGGNSTAWLLTGNAGTNDNVNFIGTTDNQSLSVKTNNIERLKISNTGRFIFHNFIGTGKTYDKNLFLGGGIDNPTTYMNTVVGISALTNNLTSFANTAVGNNVMNSMTSGNYNTSVGVNSMSNFSSGSANSAFGLNSMEGAGIYNENSSFGQASLNRTSASASDIVSYNTAIGSRSIAFLKNGEFNVALGFRALTIESGNDNIAIGAHAGGNLSSGSNNILIGKSVNASSSSASNELNIGNWIYGNNGKISIGGRATVTCSDCSEYNLFVKKGIRAEKVRVDIATVKGWADYVFTKDYPLMPLNKLEQYITTNGHLPNIPTAEEVVKEGVDLGAMDAKLLEKIEELTLHTIELNKKNESQQKLIDDLVQRLEKLEKNAKQ